MNMIDHTIDYYEFMFFVLNNTRDILVKFFPKFISNQVISSLDSKDYMNVNLCICICHY